MMRAHYSVAPQLIWYSLLYLVAGLLLAGIVKGCLKDEKKWRMIANIVGIVDLFGGVYLIVNQIGGSLLLLLFAGATVRLAFLGDSHNVKEDLDNSKGHFADL